jgi:hypothetical protein
MSVHTLMPDDTTPCKMCTECKRLLPLSGFGKKRASKDGHSGLCLPCGRAYFKARRAANPEAAKETRIRWRKKNPNYTLEWQRKNQDKHRAANARYVERILVAPKPSDIELKACKTCEEVKPLSAFWRETKRLDGRHDSCTVCMLAKKRRKFYGVTDAMFREMWTTQRGLCGICDSPLAGEYRNSFVVDHNHNTGAFRGLLCSKCNCGIGLLKDDPRICEAAAAYLREKM